MAEVPQTLVLTGVAGAGKSTVGRAVAARTGAVLLDADDFHTDAARNRMAGGIPLDDGERGPWIERIVAELDRRARSGERVVLACSALRRQHRAQLLAACPEVAIVHLEVGREELARRLAGRDGHFMPAELLESQLDSLEHPGAEHHAVVDGEGPIEAVVDEVLRAAAGSRSGPRTLSRRRRQGHDRSMHDTARTNVDHQGLEVLAPEECWQLLRDTPVGRVAFIEAGDPMVLPVNHAVDGHRIVFRTLRGSLLHEALMAAPVAFQVDDFDPIERTGWSVLVRGVADLAEDPEQLAELELHPWADTVDRNDWVQIRADEVTGRRIVHAGS